MKINGFKMNFLKCSMTLTDFIHVIPFFDYFLSCFIKIETRCFSFCCLSGTKQFEDNLATNGAFNPKTNDYPNQLSSRVDLYPAVNSSLYTTGRQSVVYNDNSLLNQYRNFHQTSLPLFDDRLGSNKNQPTNFVNPNTYQAYDPLEPQPYDPVTGFTIFFDFIFNLPITTDHCRLITSIHHSQSGLGQPSQLETFQCQPFVNTTTGEQTTITFIATRQPVPRLCFLINGFLCLYIK